MRLSILVHRGHWACFNWVIAWQKHCPPLPPCFLPPNIKRILILPAGFPPAPSPLSPSLFSLHSSSYRFEPTSLWKHSMRLELCGNCNVCKSDYIILSVHVKFHFKTLFTPRYMKHGLRQSNVFCYYANSSGNQGTCWLFFLPASYQCLRLWRKLLAACRTNSSMREKKYLKSTGQQDHLNFSLSYLWLIRETGMFWCFLYIKTSCAQPNCRTASAEQELGRIFFWSIF